MITGIYMILNLINGKFYIGSSEISFKYRFANHISALNNNKHNNKYLQHAWNKYGAGNFQFTIIEEVKDLNKLLDIEQLWINASNCCNQNIGYNICKIAKNRTGMFHTEESKRKISIAHKKIIKSPEWQAKINASLKGKKRPEDLIEKLAILNRSRKHTEETKAKMSKSQKSRKYIKPPMIIIGEPLIVKC